MSEDATRRISVAILLVCCLAIARWGAERSVTTDTFFDPRTEIDVNTASAAELELLPRIGPKLARAIVQDRESSGVFDALDDLARVPRIGTKTVDALRAYATTRAPAP